MIIVPLINVLSGYLSVCVLCFTLFPIQFVMGYFEFWDDSANYANSGFDDDEVNGISHGMKERAAAQQAAKEEAKNKKGSGSKRKYSKGIKPYNPRKDIKDI